MRISNLSPVSFCQELEQLRKANAELLKTALRKEKNRRVANIASNVCGVPQTNFQ